jgi:hypothetical protein
MRAGGTQSLQGPIDVRDVECQTRERHAHGTSVDGVVPVLARARLPPPAQRHRSPTLT